MNAFPSTHNASDWTSTVESAIRAITPAGGGEVRYRDVTAHIESLPGFPGWESWGMRPHKGGEQPKALRAVTLAAGKLKDRGVIVQPRRGYYLLVQDTPMPTPTPTPAPEPTPAPKAKPAPVKATVTRTVPVVTEAGVQYIPPTVTAVDGGYGDDAGLRRMAVEATRCFGSWSTRSDQCGSCPLAALCQQAGMADFAEVAAALDAETERAVANAAQPTPAPAAKPASEGVSFAPASGMKVVQTPFDLTCTVCDKQIPMGSDVVHVPGKGACHPGCAH
jgi:hypothetical protein